MCTSIYDKALGVYLGRTLDVEREYGQKVVTVPQGKVFDTVYQGKLEYKYSAVGAAVVSGGVPLFFDGFNSAGLAACALNFGSSCKYHAMDSERFNLASFELIPYALSQLSSVAEVLDAFSCLNITEDSYGNMPPTPLHWIFADSERAITVESVDNGTCISKNNVGVLTNAPEYKFHLYRASEIMGLSNDGPHDNLTEGSLFRYSRGMGAIGLPGDLSSASRFMRALFYKRYADKTGDGLSRMLHIFDSVSVTRGAVICEDGTPSYTAYTSVMDLQKKVYYFTTYENREIRAVKLKNQEKCKQLCAYPMEKEQNITFLN